MKAAFRTPLSAEEIRFIIAPAPPERLDCALLRYAAPSRREPTPRSGGSESSPA